jgi:NAD(P)-dependent dehydrogenase (short-subunit alcohol dehydrogenase family)
MQKSNVKKKIFENQTQSHPGLEFKMDPLPLYDDFIAGSNLLFNKKCVITGGDSGIGRAVAIAFAKEGADVAIIHLEKEQQDADETVRYIKDNFNKECISVATDLAVEKNCKAAIKKIATEFEHIDILVNNAGIHFPEEKIENIKTKNLIETFSVNVFAMFWITQTALPFMSSGGSIINTASVTAYRGSAGLLDYSATKGAIVAFTRSLSANLISKGIRVNGVAPGPIWTPLIPSSFPADEVAKFGTDSPMKRPGQPVEAAGAYVFLASEKASYISGQFIHINGGEIVNA